MKSVMTHDFSRIPRANIPRSVYNRSHGGQSSWQADYIYPCFFDEMIPADDVKIGASGFIRMTTPLVPLFDNLKATLHFFFVPLRLLQDNFPKLMGEQTDPLDSVDYLTPLVSFANETTPYQIKDDNLYAYLTIPMNKSVQYVPITNYFGRAYNLIWNEWYRDQNLQDSVVVDKDDGPDDSTDYVLKKRGVRHDYFRSALPWPQKGPAVPLPLGDRAPVYGEPLDGTANLANKWQLIADPAGSPYLASSVLSMNPDDVSLGAQTIYFNDGPLDDTGTYLSLGSVDDYTLNGTPPYADLSEATASTINQLRQAFAIQKLYERDARGGTRYTELIRAHFGVISPDARLQRPEYLGGGTTFININPVAQTSPATGEDPGQNTPQGNLAAFAVGSINAKITKSFTEHGVLLGLLSFTADLRYQQGVDKMFTRRTKHDFYWPALAHIGEQAIMDYELYVKGTAADQTDVLAYQERFAEMRYKKSWITGKLNSDAENSLDIWQLAQDFGAPPSFDASFIESNTPMDRILAVPSEPHFIGDLYFNYIHARALPTYGVPGMMDYF